MGGKASITKDALTIYLDATCVALSPNYCKIVLCMSCLLLFGHLCRSVIRKVLQVYISVSAEIDSTASKMINVSFHDEVSFHMR